VHGSPKQRAVAAEQSKDEALGQATACFAAIA